MSISGDDAGGRDATGTGPGSISGYGAGSPADPLIRRAVAADVPALVRLRALMLQEMGLVVGDQDAEWRHGAGAWFERRLRDTSRFAVFVADDPELGLVSCAAGICEDRAPSPTNVSGFHGHVFNISTDVRRRRLGHARACLVELLGWFRDETAAGVISLNATEDGMNLYRSLGFEAPGFPPLQLRIEGLDERPDTPRTP
jgi:ribosomal protein S18 acetylase RimI-like enzyme